MSMLRMTTSSWSLLEGLPTEYESFIITLDSTSPDAFTFKYVISRLSNEESCHTIPVLITAAATAKKKTPIEQITCYKCQKKGHYKSSCPELEALPETAIYDF
jgi:hypothetical protein